MRGFDNAKSPTVSHRAPCAWLLVAFYILLVLKFFDASNSINDLFFDGVVSSFPRVIDFRVEDNSV